MPLSADAMLVAVEKAKLKVSNLYLGTHGYWFCYLRANDDELPSGHRGNGWTAAEAISNALTGKPKFSPVKRRASSLDEDLF